MSFRNWLPSPPIGVGLVVALGLIGAGLHNHYLAPDSQRIIESGEVQLAKDNRQSANDRDKAERFSVHGLVEGRQHLEDASTDEICDDPDCYSRENLRAQIRMAKASEEFVSLTEQQGIARYIEIFLLVGTVSAALWAARAATSAVGVARTTAKQELRAYVSVTPNFVTGFSPTTRAAVKFAMVNRGTTPARNVTQFSVVDIFPYPLPQDFPFPDPMLRGAGAFIIHPSETFIGSRVASRLFKKAEMEDVVAGTSSRIYIFGEVRYEDVFGVERRTRFCSSIVGSENLARVAGLRGAVPDEVNISYEPSDQHNEAT